MEKNKQIALIGGGGHAGIILSILRGKSEYTIAGYTDVEDKGIIKGAKYLGKDDVLCTGEIPYCAIGITYLNSPVDRSVRNKIIDKLLNAGIQFPTIISNQAIISSDVNIGEGTVISNGAIVNNDANIGSFAIINTGVIVEHNCQIGHHTILSPGVIICGDARIGQNTFIGAGSIVRDGVQVASNVLIGAGSNVTSDVKEPGLYLGNPAKKVKDLFI